MHTNLRKTLDVPTFDFAILVSTQYKKVDIMDVVPYVYLFASVRIGMDPF